VRGGTGRGGEFREPRGPPSQAFAHRSAEKGALAETAAGAQFLRTPRQTEDNDLDACRRDWRLLPRDLCAPTAQMIRRGVARSTARSAAICLAGPWKVAGVAAAERQMQQLARRRGARADPL